MAASDGIESKSIAKGLSELPEPCHVLRDRLVELLVAADELRGSNCQLNHLSSARREAKCQDMKGEFKAVRKAIKSAIAAIPGVAGFVDPMLEGPPGQWTTALRQELESLQALLLRHGHLAPSTDSAVWDKRVESIHKSKSWLSSADYSAIAGDPAREATLRASAVETAELIARRFKTCRSTMRLAIWMHCAVESERRQAAPYRGARQTSLALLGLIEAETGIRLDSNLLIHGMVLELGGQPRRPDLVQQYADVLRQLDEADREKGLVERLLDEVRRRLPMLLAALEPRRGQVQSQPADASSSSEATHSVDFVSVNWFGTRYMFSKGNQAQSVRVLWEAWQKGGHGLTQETIGSRIDSSSNSFSLKKTFRKRKQNGNGYEQHPAWGTMIQPVGKGCFALVKPQCDSDAHNPQKIPE